LPRAAGILIATALLLALAPGRSPAAQVSQSGEGARADAVAALLRDLEAALQSGRAEALDPLLADDFDRSTTTAFTSGWAGARVSGAVVHERDRAAIGQDGRLRLVLEVLLEFGQTGRMLTWEAIVTETARGWRFASIRGVASLEGLHRLELDVSRQFAATDLKVTGEDFELLLARGDVFLCTVPAGIAGLVLIGDGEMTFEPSPETERRQLENFNGRPALHSGFRAAFLRLSPSDYESRVTEGALREVPPVRRAVQAALAVFRDESTKSYAVDLGELSRDAWSLLPSPGDFLAEVRTRRFGTLTYVQASDELEDITMFDRARRRNISVYASRARLEERGPFYREDDRRNYDVLDYNVDVSFTPNRLWFEGRAAIRTRMRTSNVGSLTLRLNSAFAVRGVSSDAHGRLLFLRVKNQDSLVVNLPALMSEGSELTFTVLYSGRLEPQGLDREAMALEQATLDLGPMDTEPSFIYSNRSYWYPQSSVSDYGSATIRFTVPATHGAVCSGVPAEGSPVTLGGTGGERRLFVFTTARPVRYLGCVVTRFAGGQSRDVTSTSRGNATNGDGQPLHLAVQTTARLRGRADDLLRQLEDVAGFYAELMHDVPYSHFTLAVVESLLPGGHSPPYFAAYNQPLPGAPITWVRDPTAFESYPEFFLAHEVAHQWWGQAIGWQNYHEQWLSEGFAQYFAALYAERRRGPDVFAGIIRQMSDWAVRSSPQGPVYLGYRLGHLKNDPRVLRALLYNKGAMVLHMLRRLTGDEAFFRSIRRFYADHRFTKAGTDDLRRSFEAETGLELGRFFERWIYGWTLPVLTSATEVERSGSGPVLVLRLAQREPLFDFAVTVTLDLKDGTSQDVIVPVREASVERRIPLPGTLQRVRVNADRAALIADD
jgi:hypothetical protein